MVRQPPLYGLFSNLLQQIDGRTVSARLARTGMVGIIYDDRFKRVVLIGRLRLRGAGGRNDCDKREG